MIGAPTEALSIIWCLVMVVSSGFAIRNAVMAAGDVRALRRAVALGTATRTGPRWYLAVGSLVGNVLNAIALVTFAMIGVLSLTPVAVHLSPRFLGEAFTWGLFAGGIVIAVLPPLSSWIRSKVVDSTPAGGVPPSPV